MNNAKQVLSHVPRFASGEPVTILVDRAFVGFLEYKAPIGGVDLGAFVEVPLGTGRALGVVWGAGRVVYNYNKMRMLTKVADVPPMRTELRMFLTRMADYTVTRLGAVLRLATRVPGLFKDKKTQQVFKLTTVNHNNIKGFHLTEARKRVLTALTKCNDKMTTVKLMRAAKVSRSVISGLLRYKVIEAITIAYDEAYPLLDFNRRSKCLNSSQMCAAETLHKSIKTQTYQTILLKGVTGSGKTEVYMQAIVEALRQSRQVLVLMPEIALTIEFLNRFTIRFGARPTQWHSAITQSQRHRCWCMVAENKAQVVIGTRSALFLPFYNLGLIVVDEEHDTSYKQEKNVLYSARDMAVLRGSICNATVVLVSATPALETWNNAQLGKYKRIDLKYRFGGVQLPDMHVIDLRKESLAPGYCISPSLQAQVQARLALSQQSLLFLNRRGYAMATVCRKCDMQMKCNHCDARLIEHRLWQRLICHRCGASCSIPKICPICKETTAMVALGIGVERLAEEAQAIFKKVRIMVLSSDTVSSRQRFRAQINDIVKGKVDIIVGTQLVAKGYHFPLLTCVGIINADLGLQGGDLRAAERSFQLIHQVAGRAGRADKKGAAYIQTYQPNHPVIRAIVSADDENFWRVEAAMRRASGVPPFGRLVGVIISGPDLSQVMEVARNLLGNADKIQALGGEIFGPVAAPVARIRGWHRVRLLIRADKHVILQPALLQWRDQIKLPRKIRITIDIDPQSFY